MEAIVATLTEGQKHMNSKIDILFHKLDHNTEVSEKALNLAIKIDSEFETMKKVVNEHTLVLKDYEINKAELRGAVKILAIMFSIVSIFISGFYYLYIQSIKTEIGDTTMQRVQNSNVQVQEVTPGSNIYKIKIFEQK